jgi:uroporphyrinogen-III decarboxylase
LNRKKDKVEQYKERLQRILDAINLKEPDRVPVAPYLETFPARYTGITIADYFLNPEKAYAAFEKTIIDFDFDTASPIPILGPASVVKPTGIKMYKMPGVDLSPNTIFQFIQKEWLKIDYDEFVNKPVDYLVRRYLPEVFSLFEPLRRLPPIPVCLLNPYTFYLTLLPALADPEFMGMLTKLMAVAQEQKQYLELASRYTRRMEKLGYPMFKGFTIYSPFDLLSDQIGGTSVIIDCYRRPDKVKKAVEVYCKKLIDNVGNGGGYILDAGTLLEYEMKPENVRAMANTARKYGVYRK